jgi:two-component system, OmpR family, sensor kinase
MRGTVEVALRRPRSAGEYREVLETTQTEIRRMCRLVEELLALTRADAGQFTTNRAPCDLAQIVQQAVAAHTAAAGTAGVQLSLDAAAPVMVNGDRDRLRQVLDNLLDNAFRYAPAGTAVTVTVQRDGADARLSVQDLGPGLSAEDQQRVFDRFYRADRSRSRQSGGLGLGLAIAKAIVGAHQGKIWVRSEPGQGTVFAVLLPASWPVEPLAASVSGSMIESL